MKLLQRVAFIGNYLPRRCGIATFTNNLHLAVSTARPDLETCVVAMTDSGCTYDYPPAVRFEIHDETIGDHVKAAEFLNSAGFDVACLQHEYGIFGGEAGGNIIELLSRLEMPVVTTLHTVLAKPTGNPVVKCDRGGEISYHGPGQLVAYALIDLRRRGWGVKQLVHTLEQSVLDFLAERGIEAARRPGAPGVYVAGRKIAQLGLRIRGGASYHGLSFNIDMDLAPFRQIRPCGIEGLEVTQLAALPGAKIPLDAAADGLRAQLLRQLEYNHATVSSPDPA